MKLKCLNFGILTEMNTEVLNLSYPQVYKSYQQVIHSFIHISTGYSQDIPELFTM